MIYVTHDQIEALTLADRIAVMSGGVIEQLGLPRDIYGRLSNRFAWVRRLAGHEHARWHAQQPGGSPVFVLPTGL